MLAVQFHPRRRGSMVNEAIEIHDSVLENVVIGSAESVLHFKEVYIPGLLDDRVGMRGLDGSKRRNFVLVKQLSKASFPSFHQTCPTVT